MDTRQTTHKGNVSDGGIANYGAQNFSENARIVNTISNHYQSHDAGPTLGYKDLESLLEAQAKWTALSPLLSAECNKNKSKILHGDTGDPNFYWITKNIDFTEWESADDSRAIWLSAPYGHGTTEVCSHIIRHAERNASKTNSSVLYFFSSAATEARCPIVFAHTLLHQIVFSSLENNDLIAFNFLKTLLGGSYKEDSRKFRKEDSLQSTIEKILSASDNEHIEALVKAIKEARVQELLIIADDLPEHIPDLLIEHIMKAALPKWKVLVTSPQGSKPKKTSKQIVCIEYDKERKECLGFLRHESTRYQKITKEHHSSLEWFWKHPQYQKWSASTTSSLLYIEGKPGSGKSTLAKYFNENFHKRKSNASSSIVARYFYTLQGKELEPTHENMLGSILHSILDQDESTFFLFQQEFRKSRNSSGSEWPFESLKEILSSFAQYASTKPIYLILDGMNESKEDDRSDIIQLLCNLCSKKNPCNIKIFIASRPIAELKLYTKEYSYIMMQDENRGDISKFIGDFLEDCHDLTKETLRETTSYITENAQGVFVWVKLIKAELKKMIANGFTDDQILDHLKGLPNELEDMYKLMFRRFFKEDDWEIPMRKRLFRLTLFARRPLTIHELNHTLIMKDNTNPSYALFRPESIDKIKARIVSCGGNFLEINADNTVQLMHETARRFLMETTPEFGFEINKKEAHSAIIEMGVRYLQVCFTSPTIPSNPSTIEDWSPKNFEAYAKYLDEWPLMHYMLPYMQEHHELCGPNKIFSQLPEQLAEAQVPQPLKHLLANHFRQSNSILRSIMNIFSRGKPAAPRHFRYALLNAAAKLRPSRLSEALLPLCTKEDRLTKNTTPLIISTQKKFTATVQLLLDLNEDIDARDITGRTALHHAVKSGNKTIVELLITQGVDKKAKDNNGYPALQYAMKE